MLDQERSKKGNQAILVCPITGIGHKEKITEFSELASSAGATILEVIITARKLPEPKFYIGSGNADMIAKKVEQLEADIILVDVVLSPAQQRNLEKLCQVQVLDRTSLILDIFSQRARSYEGMLQVELAQLKYLSTRLVRGWTHLERQKGGIGMRGPGETQLETDRRLLAIRVKKLNNRLDKVIKQREQGRNSRKQSGTKMIAFVGYTNAGKSTLFNKITHADAYVADQLFATLDPTLRQIKLPNSVTLMMSDTVGFVQELPHELVNAFRATLEEVIEADLILHVRDISDAESPNHKSVVMETLKELGLDGDHAPPIVEVLNKIDLAPKVKTTLRKNIDGSRIALSAITGQGMDDLMALLAKWSELNMVELDLQLPIADGKTLAWCHEHGLVLSEQADDEWLKLKVRISPKFQSQVQDWVVEAD
ncbi:MAG: GTPase HflX [Kangiellaceae bacterium]|nr:GTPase HflX [Kangiellaceae bacterium]